MQAVHQTPIGSSQLHFLKSTTAFDAKDTSTCFPYIAQAKYAALMAWVTASNAKDSLEQEDFDLGHHPMMGVYHATHKHEMNGSEMAFLASRTNTSNGMEGFKEYMDAMPTKSNTKGHIATACPSRVTGSVGTKAAAQSPNPSPCESLTIYAPKSATHAGAEENRLTHPAAYHYHERRWKRCGGQASLHLGQRLSFPDAPQRLGGRHSILRRGAKSKVATPEEERAIPLPPINVPPLHGDTFMYTSRRMDP
eukprot:gene4009-2863_t